MTEEIGLVYATMLSLYDDELSGFVLKGGVYGSALAIGWGRSKFPHEKFSSVVADNAHKFIEKYKDNL